ncbi:MAG: hypothetical protein KJP25_06680 [Gammaproteobacteria bacterium]|nr:hypothetical protein [Gammaproteobacteria bacterium]NNM11853.1 hypothetical protein [Pseudomonadales bacterium]RZV51048.1 MAG: hypothetical protein EX270_10795 [Pseudomonadales bacterium]
MENSKNRWTWLGLALALTALLIAHFAHHNVPGSNPVVETSAVPSQRNAVTGNPNAVEPSAPGAAQSHVPGSREIVPDATPDATPYPGTANTKPAGPRNYRELIELAKNATGKSPQEVLFDDVTRINAVDGVFHLPAPGTTYQFAPENRLHPLRLHIIDSGVMAGDANPVARFTGPSGRHLVQATCTNGAVEVSLPPTTLANGVYILDINPHRPRTSQQRRYILQLTD